MGWDCSPLINSKTTVTFNKLLNQQRSVGLIRQQLPDNMPILCPSLRVGTVKALINARAFNKIVTSHREGVGVYKRLEYYHFSIMFSYCMNFCSWLRTVNSFVYNLFGFNMKIKMVIEQ